MVDPNLIPTEEQIERARQKQHGIGDAMSTSATDIDAGAGLIGAAVDGISGLASGVRGLAGKLGIGREDASADSSDGGFSALTGALGDVASTFTEAASRVAQTAGDFAGSAVEHAPGVVSGAAEVAGKAGEAVAEGIVGGIGDLLN